MSDKMIQVKNVSHSYGDVQVLKGVDFTINKGEFIAIVGPSGCGKTTLLNLISGYEKPNQGTITQNGKLRMVYQQDGLFPWLTVIENVGLGVRTSPNGPEKQEKLQAIIDLVGLNGFENHYPHQLSGGMRQRAELARALTGESDILLMDEPFSALDYLTRLKMRHELVRLLKKHPRTVILVTHDIEEAAQLADRIIPLTSRPATNLDEKRIKLKKPRSLTDPIVTEAVHDLLSSLSPAAVSVNGSVKKQEQASESGS